ncbi:DNA double-strand break repair ATPase Rad50 [Halobacterium salinarum]|uniref:DNA double-strand break repair ATPase Rad50 n=1 Tax=Halobacterium salinarum TaxID=2242 RepID=UPI001F33C815|nr:DNA double-strand break repair ATPase Rad50 [Halobacterium salinarum]MCF2207802.1 DNA double-strand break repair ATPase Rad50 [Halobacterium salinarum]
MRFTRLSLSNFKCYADAAVSLDPGVTVIHGLNGSGKSSLLDACFFALYGTTALDTTLADAVTIGAETAEIDLHFEHAGGDYHVHRRIRASGGRAQTAACVLETPTDRIDGVTDVEAHISGLLRMDAEAFVNCAYVRQGEVNKLINAAPSTRQDMIDALLQLGKLEEYRQRAGDARLGVEDVKSNVEGQLDRLADQIADKEAADPHDRLASHNTALAEVTADIEHFETEREQARQTRDDAADVLERYEESRTALADVEETIADVREAVAEAERERETLADRVSDHRERASDLDDEAAALAADLGLDDPDAEDASAERDAVADQREAVAERVREVAPAVSRLTEQADSAADDAATLDERAETLREEAAALDAEADDAAAKRDDAAARIEALDADIEAAMAAFDDAPVAFGDAEAFLDDAAAERDELRERAATLRADRQSAADRVAEAEALLDEGKCPECGQPVEGAPHVERVTDDRERVAELDAELADVEDELDAVAQRVDRGESLVAAEDRVDDLEQQRERAVERRDEQADIADAKRDQAAEKRDRAADLDAEAEDARADAAAKRDAADEKRETLAALNADQTALKERLDALADLVDRLEAAADAREAAQRLAEKRAALAAQNEQRRDRLSELRERKRTLDSEFDADRIETARADKDRAEDYLEQVEPKLRALREDRDDLQAKIGAAENAIAELESLREEHERVQSRHQDLQAVHDEVTALETMYGELRAELRQQNVSKLERLLNETFELVYQNDSYARIKLSGEYELTVYQKDGEPLEPAQLSGGERALFNLSLRTAVYRLLAEGIDGDAPLPPLILDEPTVFLDSGHVSQLVELVESMRRLGVEQIVVVSHDDELVAAADDVVRVAKDATSNRSRVSTPEHI